MNGWARDVHVRPGQSVEGVEAEAGVFDEDGALDLCFLRSN
jgi:hypothetical protein